MDNSHRHGNAVLLSGSLQCLHWGSPVDDPAIPAAQFQLGEASPNPFMGRTQFHLELKEAAKVSAGIHNLRGQKVRLLLSRDLSAGTHTLDWDGKNDRGEGLPSGVYLIRISSGQASQTRKMLLLH